MSHSVHFRCTFCQHVIPWPIAPEALGLAPGDQPESGRLYPYTRCYCGWGKFVLCEEIAEEVDQGRRPAHVHDHDH